MSSKIERRGNTWARHGGGFIKWSPELADTYYESDYITARVGSQEFWCEDKNDFVYSFKGLLGPWSSAPKYMQALARRVKRDIEKEKANETRMPEPTVHNEP